MDVEFPVRSSDVRLMIHGICLQLCPHGNVQAVHIAVAAQFILVDGHGCISLPTKIDRIIYVIICIYIITLQSVFIHYKKGSIDHNLVRSSFDHGQGVAIKHERKSQEEAPLLAINDHRIAAFQLGPAVKLSCLCAPSCSRFTAIEQFLFWKAPQT